MVQRRDAWWVLASAGSALVVLGPALGPGELLWRDAVFAPGPVWSGRLLGLADETPRAVPSDLLLVALSHLLPAHVAGALLLVAILTGAGWGTARLLGRGVLAGLAAAVAAVWNPYVAERLAAGQWPVLLGYAAVPWVVAGLVGWLRHDRHRRTVVGPVVVGALGGASALLVVAVALVGALVALLAARGHRGRLAAVAVPAAAVLLSSVVWALPSLLRSSITSDREGFRAFAPRPDLPIGLVASVVTGGGIWNADAVPPGRDSVAGTVLALLLLAVAGLGLGLQIHRRNRDPDLMASLGAGVAALAVVGLAMVPALADHLAGIPGGGLLRDAVRQLGPWIILLAVGVGLAADAVPSKGPWAPARWGAILLPAACLSGMAWGLGGQLGTAHYPAEARRVVDPLNADHQAGSVVVLPYAAYRRYAWNEGRSSLAPWSRMVARSVVSNTDLVVATPQGRIVVRGEEPTSAQVGRALAQPDPAAGLAELGVRWAIVDDASGTPPAGFVRASPPGPVTLWRLAGGPAAVQAPRPPVPVLPVLAADGVALAGTVWLIASLRRGTRPRPMATMR